MIGIKLSRLRLFSNSLYSSSKSSSALYNSLMKPTGIAYKNYVRPSYGSVNGFYNKTKLRCAAKFMNICSKVAVCYHKSNPMSALSSTSSNLPFRSVFPFVLISPVLIHQSQSLSFSSKVDKVSAASGGAEVDVSKSDGIGSGWGDKVKDAWHSAADTIGYTGQKAKEVSNELKPHVNQLLDTHPYLKDVVLPVGLLRRFHEYAIQTSILPSGRMLGDQVPYDKSLWGALEGPVRYVITFMAISQITVPSQYIVQAWRGAAVLSFVWFLHRWKTNVLGCALATKTLAALDREKLLTIDRFSSVGLFVIGIMALAEASGVAVQCILTVGGVGGRVATAFAARDIFGNVLSGLYMQFSKPFPWAGSVKVQVVEMGLASTTVLNSERFPDLVPNSLFSSQVIVNKSRARWRAVVTKIPLLIEDLDKVPEISNEIKSMLKSNSKVFLGKEVPYCFLSHVEGSYAELTVGCNLRHMSKDELYSTHQDILLQSVRIIKKHGATLGSTFQCPIGQRC
ncbi:hypothetical protein ES332_A12G125800v1 [Gossypium tomentosum]|uniref:Mechanosensitive ion channel protein MscS n=1 Tax=Gossypium tomentosum TaxID=34277 RepID=A0A5D2MX62_GOSTO|nr:hypothetical protein ES332_A12G125800v1 [Gossypium tomentosum]